MQEKVELMVQRLKELNITLAAAESLTGGLFSSTLTSIPGVSKIFKGAAITYQNEVKHSLLNVPYDLINTYGVVSKEVAKAMAEGATKMQADLTVSFTGNAGPDVMEGKPVGLVYIGLKFKGFTYTFEVHLSGTRNEIRKQCVEKAVDKILELINAL